MSKKKRRKGRDSSGGQGTSGTNGRRAKDRDGTAGTGPAAVGTRSQAGRPRPRERTAASTATAGDRPEPGRPSPAIAYPPVGLSLARGLGAVVSSPVLLVTSLLAALALWALFAAYGILLAATPGVMALLESLPPVHSFFLDLRLVAGGPSSSSITVALSALGVLVIRGFLLAFWIALLADRVQGGGPSWRGAAGRAWRMASRSFRRLFAIEAGSLVVALVALFLSLGFLGAGLGQLAVLGALIGSVYFLIFTPIIAVLEGGALRWIARTSVRAARVPGPQHMLLAFVYIALALFVSTLTPGSRVAAATPSIAVWAYVLFVGLLHLTVLGAFVFRWLHVRGPVLAQVAGDPGAPPPPEAPSEPARAR